jgi:hypothetical protein
LHNFIVEYDPEEHEELLQLGSVADPNPGQPVDHGSLSQSRPGRAEKERAEAFRDQIAGEMWIQYQEITHGGNQEVEAFLDVESYD